MVTVRLVDGFPATEPWAIEYGELTKCDESPVLKLFHSCDLPLISVFFVILFCSSAKHPRNHCCFKDGATQLGLLYSRWMLRTANPSPSSCSCRKSLSHERYVEAPCQLFPPLFLPPAEMTTTKHSATVSHPVLLRNIRPATRLSFLAQSLHSTWKQNRYLRDVLQSSDQVHTEPSGGICHLLEWGTAPASSPSEFEILSHLFIFSWWFFRHRTFLSITSIGPGWQIPTQAPEIIETLPKPLLRVRVTTRAEMSYINDGNNSVIFQVVKYSWRQNLKIIPDTVQSYITDSSSLFLTRLSSGRVGGNSNATSVKTSFLQLRIIQHLNEIQQSRSPLQLPANLLTGRFYLLFY